MLDAELIAITSRSFSRSVLLRERLKQSFPNVKFNDAGVSLCDDSLLNFLKGASRVIIGLEKIDSALLSQLPDLKVICKMGTGTDKIDFNAIKQYQVEFSATPGLNKRSVSELVLGLIFTLIRHLSSTADKIKSGVWQQPTGTLLTNKTVGIVGYGAVGQDLAEILRVFGCRCLVYDINTPKNVMSHVLPVSLESLLQKSDIVSLHVPLSSNTYHLIGRKELQTMKPGSILINTARGGLIDEAALYGALYEKHISAAALDVFETEPDVPKKLLSLDNFFATSHIGGSTYEAIEAMGLQAIKYLEEKEFII